MTARDLGSGLDMFASVFDPKLIATVLEKSTRWVDPVAFKRLPVWFPEKARKNQMYKSGWVDVQTNKGLPKREANEAANTTLTKALGTASNLRREWTCCHIWGNDDASYGSDFSEVNDARYYSCPANIVLVPTPLKALTDFVPEVTAVLRLVSAKLYGFVPEGRSLPNEDLAGDWYPTEWRAGRVQGICSMTPLIAKRIKQRFKAFSNEFEASPGHYPKAKAAETIRYWQEHAPSSLFAEIAL